MEDEDLYALALGKLIRVKRLEHKLTLEQLAERAGGLSDKQGRIDRGEKIPSSTTLFMLYNAFDFSIDWLFDDIKAELNSQNDNYS